MAKKNTDEVKIVERTDDELAALEKATPIEDEVINEQGEPDGYPTFTVTIDGDDVELEDRYRRDRTPAGLMLLGSNEFAAKYAPALLEQLIGEDQMLSLLAVGADTEELQSVVKAWAAHRGLGNG